VRQLEVADAAVLDAQRARHGGIAHRPLERGLHGGAAGAADVVHEPLEDAEVRHAVRTHRDALVVEAQDAGDIQLGVLAHEAHLRQPDRMAIERHADRRCVPEAVIEEAQAE
jgi:hypothetical protein